MAFGRKETDGHVKDLNHSIDLLDRVIEIKACASGTRYAEPSHQRLITMMSTAHRQAILICKRGQIVRVRSIDDKPDQSAPLFPWTKNASSRQVVKAIDCVTRQFRIVFEDSGPADAIDVIHRCAEPDCAGDIRRSRFETVRRFLKRARFESDGNDHFATAMPWWHCLQELPAALKQSDTSRCTH